jgi:hypothetical protein
MAYEYMTGMGAGETISAFFGPAFLKQATETTSSNGVAAFRRLREGRQERIAAIREQACSGVGCPDGTVREGVRPDYSDAVAALALENEMRERGCSLQCMEDGMSWYCCPQAIQQMTLMMPTELEVTPQETAETAAPAEEALPAEQPGGFPWGAVAVLGVLGLGIGGAVWYWKTR